MAEAALSPPLGLRHRVRRFDRSTLDRHEHSGDEENGKDRQENEHVGLLPADRCSIDDGRAVGKFDRPRDQAEDVAIERERGLEVRYGDAHVRDARLVGHGNEGNRSRERT